MEIDGDPPPVVGYLDHIPLFDNDLDVGTVSGKGFVDAVVYEFVYKVMQAVRPGGADIHAWSFPNCLQPFKDLDLFS
jgi:hypothetical protein